MPETDERYYSGFEGESEYFFVVKKDGTELKRLGIWDGYMNDMLMKIEPTDEGWTGIMYYFHVGMFEDDHWTGDKMWQLDDLPLVYDQLSAAKGHMRYSETAEVLEAVLSLVKDAMENDEEVYIYEE